MKKIYILITTVLISYFQLKAQNVLVTPLTWTVSQLTDLNNNKTMAYQCTFQTNGTQSIQWVQKKMTSQLEVTRISGTWPEVNTDGIVVFDISVEGETGTLTFAKDSEGTSITIDLSQSGQTRLRHRYMVTKLQ